MAKKMGGAHPQNTTSVLDTADTTGAFVARSEMKPTLKTVIVSVCVAALAALALVSFQDSRTQTQPACVRDPGSAGFWCTKEWVSSNTP